MTIFWILASGLIGLALLFVLPPLQKGRKQTNDPDRDELNLALFRQQLEELDSDLAAGKLDPQQHKAARQDLERELLYDVGGTGTDHRPNTGGGRWTAALLAVVVPATAVLLYLFLGNPEILPRLEAAASAQALATRRIPGSKIPPLDVVAKRLAAKLEQSPEDLDGWLMLGRTYFAIGQPKGALYAAEKAYGLEPENPDVLVAYAEAIAANNDSKLAGMPAELIQTALKINPEHIDARWLEGLVSFQDARYVQAAEQWETLLATFNPQSAEAAELKRYIVEAYSRAAPEPMQVGQAPQTGATADSGQGTARAADKAANAEKHPTSLPGATGGVTVEVSLAEHLWRKADANDNLFVYAKAVSGPPMPLAARRARVADLPLTLTLDDSMAMIPAMKLSGFEELTLGARISKSGQAMPQSGDLEGEVSPVKRGHTGTVKILIDRVMP
jgi:cytochrome c-type biogenesis protein CcmH